MLKHFGIFDESFWQIKRKGISEEGPTSDLAPAFHLGRQKLVDSQKLPILLSKKTTKGEGGGS